MHSNRHAGRDSHDLAHRVSSHEFYHTGLAAERPPRSVWARPGLQTNVLQLSGMLAGDVKESRNDNPTGDIQMAADRFVRLLTP